MSGSAPNSLRDRDRRPSVRPTLGTPAAPDERWTLVGNRLERRQERRDHSVREQTYRQIRQAIVHCELEPGAALSEQELSAQLGVSRTPVREALLRLSDDGLVIIAPQRGTVATSISPRQVREAQLVREVLERSLLALASQRDMREAEPVLEQLIASQRRAAAAHDYGGFLDADQSFHNALAAVSGYDGVSRLATTARAHLDRVRALSLPESYVLDSRIGEHVRIVERLCAGDLKGADATLTEHLRSALDILPLVREHHPDYFADEADDDAPRGRISIALEQED